MKIIIISSGNAGYIAPFVKEQVDSLKRFNIKFDFFFITGKGIKGYLTNLSSLKKKVQNFNPDLIHAHYGLSGFLSLFVKRKIPLIVSFHGNDINPIPRRWLLKLNLNRALSAMTYRFCHYSIFVNKELPLKVWAKPEKYSVIPCHVDIELFNPVDKLKTRATLGFSLTKRYILFSSSFDNPVKNYQLAKNACSNFKNLDLIELAGYSRKQVSLLLNACDLVLITSFNEGSSQILKEAMACNCPIVTTAVGDASAILDGIEGCYITSFRELDVIENIGKALDFSLKRGKTRGRQRIIEMGLGPYHTSQKIFDVYLKTIDNVRNMRYNSFR